MTTHNPLIAHKTASSSEDFRLARQLIEDYARFLDVDLCFQNFTQELDGLSTMYGSPNGCQILAFYDNQLAGGVGLRRFDERRCEMKRLYVYPAFNGLGIGTLLVDAVIAEARRLSYKQMVLDTIPKLDTALQMYFRRGFSEIPPYYDNPHRHTMKVYFLALEL
ncbi:MAG TPA: GNAT family N-acetyltransferase [Rhodothermales bacterium]|nr:GNAT family N-acetyltransferase [Bacteroidota bacterium]HRK75295.1 GNAT family N-acetyltransferase [Rhodothermales bacterium]HRR08905.1 GNAT family N-acetyltransferase [Rhodothermales bacterium]